MAKDYNYLERREVYERAIEAYGIESQKHMVMEECGELITALAREPRGRSSTTDILSEVADVFILCEQMALIYGDAEFCTLVDLKMERLEQRLNASATAETQHHHVDTNGIIR